MRRLMALLLMLAGLGVAGPPPADIDGDLTDARRLYAEGQFGAAIVKLQRAIGQLEQMKDVRAHQQQLADAHLHLALSLIGLDDPGSAKESFKAMLRLDPTRTLDPQVHAPKVIAIYDQARAELAREPAAAAAPTKAPQPSPAPAARKGGSKLPLVLVGIGGVAGAGAALAGGGGGGAVAPPPTSTPTSTTVPSSQTAVELVAASPASGATLSAGSQIVFSFRYTVSQEVCFHVRVIDTAGNPCIGVALTRPPATNGAADLPVSTSLDTRSPSCLERTVQFTRLDVSFDLPASCPGSGDVSRLIERSFPVSYTVTR